MCWYQNVIVCTIILPDGPWYSFGLDHLIVFQNLSQAHLGHYQCL